MSAAEILPWPAALAGASSIAVIERAIERRRLSHSLLLTGDDVETLQLIALGLADRLLNTDGGGGGLPGMEPPRFAPEQHPDFFALRPTGKMRQISAEATRTLI